MRAGEVEPARSLPRTGAPSAFGRPGAAAVRGNGPARRRASFAQTARAVAWSFFGVRRRADYESDSEQLNPVHVIIMGVIGAALFVAVLIGVVRWVVG
jgi:hypothetical protein